jgi:O-antigen ligase
MSLDHPFGSGFRGFNFYAPEYISEEIKTGASRHRSVHSSWFEVLTEIGYLGLFSFLLMVFFTNQALNKSRKILESKNAHNDSYLILAIQTGLIIFMISMSFMNRMRAEVLYWLILYSACAYNIYYFKKQTEIEGDEIQR